MKHQSSETKDISLATKRDLKQLLKESAERRQHESNKEQMKLLKKDQQIAALKMEHKLDLFKHELLLANSDAIPLQRRRVAFEEGSSYMPALMTYR